MNLHSDRISTNFISNTVLKICYNVGYSNLTKPCICEDWNLMTGNEI